MVILPGVFDVIGYEGRESPISPTWPAVTKYKSFGNPTQRM